MKKILFLSANYPHMMTCGASRAFRIASMLPENGWQPLVVAPADLQQSGSDGGSAADQFPCPVYRAGESVDVEAFDPERLEKLLQGMTVAPPVGSALRVISGLFPGVNLHARWEKLAPAIVTDLLAMNGPVDAVYAQGPGMAPLLLALELAEKHRLPVVFDLVAPLDSHVSGGKSDAERLEERILISGYPVITPTRAMKEYFLKKYFGKVTHDDITIIQDFCILPDSLREAGAQQSAAQSCVSVLLEDVTQKELKVFMAALGRFVANTGVQQPSLSFIGGDRKLLEKYARKFLSSVPATFLPRLSDHEELGHIASSSMFGVLTASHDGAELMVPERLVDAAGMGKPLFVIGPDGPAARLAGECGGVASPLQNAESLAGLLGTLWSQSQELRRGMPSAWTSGRFSPFQSVADLTKLLAYMLPI